MWLKKDPAPTKKSVSYKKRDYEVGSGWRDAWQRNFYMSGIDGLAVCAVNRRCEVVGAKRQIYPKVHLYLQQIAKASRFYCAPRACGKDCEHEF